MNLENVLYEVRDHVAHVTMNRPETMNAMSSALIRDVDAALLEAERDDDVRVVIFRGAGRSFSAGHDLSGAPREHRPDAPPGTVENRFDYEDEFYVDANLRIRNLKKPTIAGLHGHVILGALMTAMMFDLVVAEEGTRLWMPGLRMGGTGGELSTLPWDLGVRKAKEYLWTGDVIPLELAEQKGMINKIVPVGRLDAECQRLADRIALMPPRIVSWTKRAMNRMLEAQGQLVTWDHQFMIHQLAHASNTAAEWAEGAADARSRGGFKEFIAYRDGPFDDQAKRDY